MSDIFGEEGWAQRVADARLQQPPEEEGPGFFEGALTGLDRGVARGGVRVGQVIGLAGSIPAIIEQSIFDNGVADRYFEGLDENVNSALDYWTPDPRTTGTVGRTLGGLGEMAIPLMVTGGNPSMLIATAELGTAMDLSRQGVDAPTAVAAGVTQGVATALGVKTPILGKTLAQRVFTGAVGNTAVNMGATFAEQKLLEGRGYEDLAKNYDPLDVEGRTVDLLMGAAFGAIHHAGAPRFTPSERAAIMTAANARHFQIDTAPGRPMDPAAAAAHQRAMEASLESLMTGEPVVVPEEVSRANFEARPAPDAIDPAVMRDAIGEIADPVLDAPNFGIDAPPRTLADDDVLLKPRHEDTTPERAALRDQIVADQIAHAKPVEGRKPIAYIMGGGGASGKGTILKRLTKLGAVSDEGVVHVDPDAIKERLPEYKQIVERGDSRAAATVHEESSTIAKRVVAEALAKKTDIVLDRTMADEAKALKEIRALKEAGYEVRLFGVTVDPFSAIRRADKRAKRSGRYVPPKELLKAHRGFSGAFETLAKEVDSARLFNNEVAEGQMASVIASKDSGNSLKVVDQEAYNVFRERAKIDPAASTERAARNAVDVDGGNRPRVGEVDASGNARGDGSGGQPLREASPSGDVPAERLTTPVIEAVRDLLIDRDLNVATGATDADGNMVVRSAREAMAAADANIAKAQADSVGFEAAVSCFLTQGFE